MWKSLQRWLEDIPLKDSLERSQASLIQMMLIGLIVLDLLALPLTILSSNNSPGSKMISFGSVVFSLVLCTGGLIAIRAGRFTAAIWMVSLGLLLSTALILVPRGLNSSWLTMFVLAIPLTYAGLIGRRGLLWFTAAASVVVVFALGILGQAAPQLVGYEAPGARFGPETAIAFVLIVGFLGLGFDRFGSVLRHTLRLSLERERELERVREVQERVIVERTTELQHALSEVELREQHVIKTLSELRVSQHAVQELSAPVIPVLKNVLVAPLIGALDGERATLLTSNLLSAVEEQKARFVIFDITGVPLVDTHVAQVLFRTTSALRLLGAEALLVGIRPEVAQTMVALNIDLGTAATYADLREAVEALLIRNGWRAPNLAARARERGLLHS